MQIAAFEIFEIGEPLDRLLNIEPKEPRNENFVAMGIESVYLFNNMGTLSIVFLIWLFAVLVNKLLK